MLGESVMATEPREQLLQWIRCPNPDCRREIHVVDAGYGTVFEGQRVHWKCDKCWAHIEKIVGKDMGRILVEGPKQDFNPHFGLITHCDRCGRMVTTSPTFVLCAPCRKRYVRLITGLAVRGLVKFCFMCGRALALEAHWCDRCGRNQEASASHRITGEKT